MKILKYPFLAILVISFNVSAQEEIKFGVSVGLEKIDYNLTQTAVDGGFGSAQNNGGDDPNASATREGSMSYMVPAIALDMKYGAWGLSIKRSEGDDNSLMPSSGYPYVGWTRDDTPEREETSFNFSYKFNNNWSLAFGAYNGSTDVNYTEGGRDTAYFQDTDGTLYSSYFWDITHTGNETADSDGRYLAAVYQNRLSNNLFWFAKAGYQQTDLDTAGQYVFYEVATANPNCEDAAIFGSCITQAQLDNFQVNETGAPGFGWDIDYAKEATGDAAVVGFGLVYVLDPKNTITFGYEFKNFSYDAGKLNLSWAGQNDANAASVGSVNRDDDIALEESADYFSITYRHQF